MSDDKLTRIEMKIDKIQEHIVGIDITLAKQHVSLDEHVRRTNLLEEQLRPVEQHVTMVSGVIKLLGALALMATIYSVFK
jgi:hypothetical protein